MEDLQAKEQEVEVIERYGDSFDFSRIFRIKGTQGLFTLNSQVNKSGMISMVEFLSNEVKRTVKASGLICLGNLMFHAEDSTMSMSDVFSNINEWEAENKKSIGDNGIRTIMEIMVPNHDDDMFKPYHAVQVAVWYEIIKSKIKVS